MAGSMMMGEWRRGWPILIAGSAGIALTTIHIYGTGLFFQPLEREFGWQRAEVSSAMVLPSIIAFLLTPIFGRFIDRLGARRVAIAGAIFYCFSVMALSFTTAWIVSWWLLWAIMGFALSVLSPAVWSTGVASWFDRSRAIALAFAFCGTGIGASLVPILTNWLINGYGWRGAFVGLGVVGLVVIVPLIVLFFFDGRYAKTKQGDAIVEAPVVPLTGYTVREGIRSPAFFRLAVAAFGGTAAIVGVLVHLVPILGTYGVDRTTAAWLAGLVGIPSIIGRLSVGFLLDRYSGPTVGAISISLPIASVALLALFPGNVPAAVIAIFILGLSIGGEYDAVIYLSTRYLGLKNFGALFSYIAALITLGLGLGPALGGLVYDMSGSYQLYFAILIPVWAICGFMLATLGKNPHATGDEHAA
jgi:MFS family permease